MTRHFNYPSYQFNVLRLIIFSRKFNVYFALSKEYALKVSAVSRVSSNDTVGDKCTLNSILIPLEDLFISSMFEREGAY